jgi:thiamine-monophosphate kinase
MSFLNEDQIIKRFCGLGVPIAQGVTGIGDDCAVLPRADGTALLVTTDLLTEGIHFLIGQISPYELGRKSLAVNLSDIAAMGGTPQSAFLSLALPRSINETWIDQFAAGFGAMAIEHKVSVLGGDTTASLHGVTVNVCVLGEAATPNVKLRSTGRPGDILAVTGTLGDSRAGLEVVVGAHAKGTDLKENGERALRLASRHHDPSPECAAGRFLGTRPGVHAMMDLSDGLLTDLKRLVQASGCGAVVNVEEIPLSAELRDWCSQAQQSSSPSSQGKHLPYEFAVIGGEDYRLLLSVDPLEWERVAASYLSVMQRPLYQIGVLTSGSEVRYLLGAEPFAITEAPFEHFRSV